MLFTSNPRDACFDAYLGGNRMPTEPKYHKDIYTGAVIFTDANAYSSRKKVIAKQKLANQAKKDSQRVINSLKNEVTGLKKLVYELIENRGD